MSRQLRRCGRCQKIGHNKATCTENTPLPEKQKSSASPLKFFVHHVTHNSAPSPHVIDINSLHSAAWNKIESAAPAPSTTPLYHYHHDIPSAQNYSKTPATPINHADPIPSIFSQTFTPSRSERLAAALDTIMAPIKNNLSALYQRAASFKFRTKKTHTSQVPPEFLPAPEVPETQTPITPPSPSSTSTKIYFWQRIREIFFRFPRFTIFVPVGIAVIIAALIIPRIAYGYFSDLQFTAQTVADDGRAGFLALYDSAAALRSANIAVATQRNQEALLKFSAAADVLQNNHQILQTIVGSLPIVGGSLTSREKLLLAGHEIALANDTILTAVNSAQTSSSSLAERLLVVTGALHTALPNYQAALSDVKGVDPSVLPYKYQAPFTDFIKLFSAAVSDFSKISDLEQPLREMLAFNGRRRYLLVFQNPAEIRPTGGFMGSYAFLEVNNGAIAKLDIPAGGTYDLQGQLDSWVEPPAPLLLSNKRWEFQDANWFPDFPTSAKKILWFYRHSRSVSADGVIAINSTVLERLLTLVGSVNLTDRNLTLTATSAIPTLQQIVETGPEKQLNKPKQILSELAPAVLTSLQHLPPSALVPLLSTVEQALEQKEIQIYFNDDQNETAIQSLGWAGKILPTESTQDYVLVVNTNIQGEKTDALMNQHISHQALVQPDGGVVDTITIEREHTGQRGEKLYGATNIDYIRVYVPMGSELISAAGFSWPDEKVFRAPEPWTNKDSALTDTEKEITIDPRSGTRVTEEFGKYAFGNWLITDPGQTSRLQLTYRLPFKVFANPETSQPLWQKLLLLNNATATYQLVAQRQSGANSTFESQIIFPDEWQPRWVGGPSMTLATNGAAINQMPLTADTVWSLLVHHN